MAQTFVSDMAQKSVAAFLERVERQRDFSPDEVRELLASCEIPILLLERLWESAQGFLDRGMEGRKLTFFLKEFEDILELGIKVFDIARDRVKAADLTPEEKTKGASVLDHAARRAAERRDELSLLLRRLEAPPREVDPSSLPTGRGDRQANGYISLDDLTARLLSREDA